MTFLNADYFWNLLWLIPLIVIFAGIGIARKRKIREALFRNSADAEKFTNADPARRILRTVFLGLAILFALTATARLVWGRSILPDAAPGRDLMFLFDVSKSMLADDVKPSRLAQGKWLVREIVMKHPGDRFGLIAFAGTSFLQCPLTIDKTSFLQLTDSLDTDTIALGGTNLQDALEQAVKAFESAEGAHKAVILITDGDELTGHAESVADQLAQAGIPLFIAGVGDPANPSVIQITDEQGKRRILTDAEGNAVKSPLNESALASLAKRTSGIYVRSTATDPGIAEIDNAVSRLELRSGTSQISGTRPIERPAWPLGISFFFLILYFCMPEIRSMRKAPGKAILFLLLCFPLWVTGQDKTAAVPSPAPEAKTSEEAPLGAEALFNLGLRAQESKKPDEAMRNYEKAIAAEDNANVRAGAYQNIGVLSHETARAGMTKANESLKNQNPDEAEKSLSDAIKKLDETEQLYRESLRFAAQTGNVSSIAGNQKVLLQDRVNASELKKQIEELKKLQEQAKQQTQQARDRQKQENNEKQKQDQQQSGQKQDQQSGQKQDQQSGQKQEQQSSAREQTKQAGDTAEQLRKQAEKLSQEQLKQSAEEAKKELDRASREQEKGDTAKAEEHLEKALKALGGENDGKPEDKKDGKDRKDGKENEDSKDEKNPEPSDSGDKQPQPPPQSPPRGKAQEAEPDRNIDRNQADSILDAMSRDEKELRDMLKEMQKRTAPQRNPEKDW